MVDVAAAGRGAAASPADRRGDQAIDDLRYSVTVADATALAAYRPMAEASLVAPAQAAEWVGAWIAHAGPDCIIASITRAGAPVLALPLEIAQAGPFRVARFLGDSHANGNFPAVPRDGRAGVSTAQLTALFEAIRSARPDIDILRLERLTEELGGVRNPLLLLGHRPSPNLALAVDLAGGFEAVLERTSGKRKRKKHRSQTRKFEAAGGYRRIEATTPAEVDRLLQAFLGMKEQRFRKMGIANVFGSPSVQAFFAALFKAGLETSPPRFVLHGLEVAGKLRAVTGSSRSGSRLICEFGAIAEDELAFASPGDFLFFDNIREAAEAGLALYDFSVGDEPYKRLWCDTEISQYDVLVPLSSKGRLYGRLSRAGSLLKSAIKNNPVLWGLVKRVRRQTAGAQPVMAERDD